jgi:hypothetical protein
MEPIEPADEAEAPDEHAIATESARRRHRRHQPRSVQSIAWNIVRDTRVVVLISAAVAALSGVLVAATCRSPFL